VGYHSVLIRDVILLKNTKKVGFKANVANTVGIHSVLIRDRVRPIIHSFREKPWAVLWSMTSKKEWMIGRTLIRDVKLHRPTKKVESEANVASMVGCPKCIVCKYYMVQKNNTSCGLCGTTTPHYKYAKKKEQLIADVLLHMVQNVCDSQVHSPAVYGVYSVNFHVLKNIYASRCH
jgi:hypothetical protein